VRRGEIWWAGLSAPVGSELGYRRPVVVIQSDAFNRSRIGTVVAAAITSNMQLAKAPGNVVLPQRESRLRRDSVVNVSQIVTLDRSFLTDRVARLTPGRLAELDEGLRLVLAL
jgi:mRNA interferase MazF